MDSRKWFKVMCMLQKEEKNHFKSRRKRGEGINMKSGRSFSLLLLISPTLLSTQHFINENCVGKKSAEEREREKKERIKNQQTTNNIILTSRAIFRHRWEEKCRKEPKACFSKRKNKSSGSGSHKLNNI